MKIKKIVSQNRRDFRAVYECEHCQHEHETSGYDDTHFHAKVVPKMECERCGEVAPNDYRPLATKHDDSAIV